VFARRPELRCRGEVTVGPSIDALKRLATGLSAIADSGVRLILDEVSDGRHSQDRVHQALAVVGSRGWRHV